jgi:hypothetical protein
MGKVAGIVVDFGRHRRRDHAVAPAMHPIDEARV